MRRYFADEKEAKAEAERVLLAMANGATRALTLTNADAEAYAMAVDELKAVGASLLPAAREYRACVEILGPKVSLIEAVRYFVASGASEVIPKTVPETVAEFVAEKTRLKKSRVHLSDIGYRLDNFAKEFPGPIAEVTKGQIKKWLLAMDVGARSRRNFAGAITSLFRWAKSEEVKYLPSGRPSAGEGLTKKEDAEDDGEDVVIYSPAEVRAILERLQSKRPELVPFVAIGAFAGLRTAEIQRLDWAEVDLGQGHIEITKRKAKTRTRRLVPILPNLAKWLDPYRGKTGSVCPYIRTQFAVQREVEGRGEAGDVKLLDWKRNALRHSFATYRIATIKSENQVALEMGNSPAMVFANYRGVATEAVAKEFWGIEPPPLL